MVGVVSVASPRETTRYCRRRNQLQVHSASFPFPRVQSRSGAYSQGPRCRSCPLQRGSGPAHSISWSSPPRGNRQRTLMTFARNTSSGRCWFSAIVRLGLPVRLAGTLVGAEGGAPWEFWCLRRWGSDSLLVKLGRGMVATSTAATRYASVGSFWLGRGGSQEVPNSLFREPRKRAERGRDACRVGRLPDASLL